MKPRSVSEIPLATLDKMTPGTADEQLISSIDKILAKKDPKSDPSHGARIDTIQNPSRIREILAEDAKRRREIAADEERREAKERLQNTSEAAAPRQQHWDWENHPKTKEDYNKAKAQIFSDYMRKMGGENAGKAEQPEPENPYTPTRMAGYYTVTTDKGDMAMRIVLKATGGNTLRAIEVQKKTDKQGKGRYTITIDPKTGKGKTDKGHTVRFDIMRDGVTFMGTLQEGSRAWRFVNH